MIRRTTYILIIALLIGPLSLLTAAARSHTSVAAVLTVEQRQQFLYYFYEAQRLFMQGEYKDAFHLFSFCHHLDDNDAAVNLYLGHVYEQSHLIAPALARYKKAWEVCPNQAWDSYAIMLYNLDDERVSVVKRNRNMAIRIMEEQGRREPNNAEVWDKLRQAYTGMGEFKKALKAQEEIDRLDGYNAYSAMNRYRLRAMMRDNKGAIEELNRYLKEDPSNLQFHLFRVQLYLAINVDYDTMADACEQILALDPYNAMVLNNYAYYMAIHGKDLQRAEDMSRRAVQQEPNEASFLDTYAWILHLKGEDTLARYYMRKAIQQVEGDVPAEMKEHMKIIGTDKE